MIDFSATVRDMQAIPTKYAGYWFRSRLEARWAVFFNEIGLRWSYEVQGFRLDDDLRYLPDFYIKNVDTPWEKYNSGWVEIKGVMKEKDQEKCRELAKQSEMPVLMLQGDPLDYTATIYRKHTPKQEVYLYAPSSPSVLRVRKEKTDRTKYEFNAAEKARSERF